MSSGAARCDQIIALIDACLSEVDDPSRAGPGTDPSARWRLTARQRADLRWAQPSPSLQTPLGAA